MSSPNDSSPLSPAAPTRRPRRYSRFVEGSAVTGPEILQRTNTTKEHFNTVLAMEDAMAQQRRERSASQTSEGSSPSHSPISESNQGPKKTSKFGRASLDERPVGIHLGETIGDAERAVKKVTGRLRAMTAGSNRNVQPYPGT